MMRASAAVGGCNTLSTRSLRARSSRRRRDLGLLVEATARVEAHGVVPEKLLLAPLGHVPGEYLLDRFRKMALAVRVVGGVHQDVFADQIDHCIGELLALRDFDTLEVAAAHHVLARLLREGRQRRGDRLSVL